MTGIERHWAEVEAAERAAASAEMKRDFTRNLDDSDKAVKRAYGKFDIPVWKTETRPKRKI